MNNVQQTNKTSQISHLKNKEIRRAKSIDENSELIHEITITTNTLWKFRFKEKTLRRIIFTLGILIGIALTEIYINKTSIFNLFKYICMLIWSVSPFSSPLLQNSNFYYVFVCGIIITFLTTLIILYIGLESRHNFIIVLIVCLLYFFSYSYIVLWVGLLLIKIPIYFKILSAIASTVIHTLGGFISCIILTTVVLKWD